MTTTLKDMTSAMLAETSAAPCVGYTKTFRKSLTGWLAGEIEMKDATVRAQIDYLGKVAKSANGRID